MQPFSLYLVLADGLRLTAYGKYKMPLAVSRQPLAVTMSQPLNFFSSRSWSGFAPAAASFASCVVIFDVLAWLAWHGDQGRMFDFVAAFIGFPSVLIALLLAAAFAWSIVGKVPFSQAFGWGIRLLPIAWIVPLIDFIRLTGSGVSTIIPFANGRDLLLMMITGGVLPLTSNTQIGIRLGLVAGTFGVAMIAWHVSKSWIKSILSGLWFSIVAVCSMSSVSLAVFWNAPRSGISWSALPNEISRRASTILGKGYWWEAMYDRFPTAIDGQADIAMRLFSAVGAASIVVVLLALLFLKEKSRRSLIRYVYGTWGFVLFASSIIVGCVFGYKNASLSQAIAFLPAYLFIVFVIIAIRLASVLRRDISNLESDERGGVHQPIVDGEISLDHAKTMAAIAESGSVVAAYLLGWPVLLMTLAYFGCARLTRDRFWIQISQVSTIFRVLGSAALAGMAFLFLTQEIHINTALLTAMGVAAAIRLLIEWFWIPKFKGVVRGA